jgi:hypothetical protein
MWFFCAVQYFCLSVTDVMKNVEVGFQYPFHTDGEKHETRDVTPSVRNSVQRNLQLAGHISTEYYNFYF